LAKGALYCVIITFFAVTLSEPARQTVMQSRSGDLIARGIRNANPILPADIREHLGKYIDELDEKLHAPPKEVTTSPVSSTDLSPAALAPAAISVLEGRGGQTKAPAVATKKQP
jgi:hypothetical protein